MRYTQAIITGASSGFGAAFARRLAGECLRLVLVARREDAMRQLAEELKVQSPSLDVMVLPCDLADEHAREELIRTIDDLPEGRTLLVNNAGLGDYGEFISATPSRNRSMIQVNIAALVELTHAVLPRLKVQGGGIINISSLAADLPIPDFAMYAASKAFVASFSEALRMELKADGVGVCCVCPGPVHTGFGDAARRAGCSDGKSPFRKGFYTEIPVVVNGALRALEKGTPRYYPSFKVRMAGLLVRCLPLWVLRAVMSMRPRRVRALPDSSASSNPTSAC